MASKSARKRRKLNDSERAAFGSLFAIKKRRGTKKKYISKYQRKQKKQRRIKAQRRRLAQFQRNPVYRATTAMANNQILQNIIANQTAQQVASQVQADIVNQSNQGTKPAVTMNEVIANETIPEEKIAKPSAWKKWAMAGAGIAATAAALALSRKYSSNVKKYEDIAYGTAKGLVQKGGSAIRSGGAATYAGLTKGTQDVTEWLRKRLHKPTQAEVEIIQNIHQKKRTPYYYRIGKEITFF